MSRRKTPLTPTLQTLEEATIAASELATLVYAEDELKAKRDAALEAISSAYIAELSALEKKAAAIEANLKLWADANPALFESKKSLDLAGHTLGYHAGQPACKARPNFDASLTALRSIRDAGGDLAASAYAEGFIRTVEEVNKQAVIAAREDSAAMAVAAAAGLTVKAQATFFFTPAKRR